LALVPCARTPESTRSAAAPASNASSA
jgi:hypothetical protein